MSGSTFGERFKITTWGESHGEAYGVVIDGCPAGLSITPEEIAKYLSRRRPGQSEYTTARKEADTPLILSGIFEGRTTGAPISMVIKNTNARSGDYSEIANLYRPGHADYTFDAKFGFRDYRGGGRSSGRETVSRVAAGAVAMKLLNELGIEVYAYTRSIGNVMIDYNNFEKDYILSDSLYMPDSEASLRAQELIKAAVTDNDSVGGVIECVVSGMPAGIGEPVFDKLDANLAKAIMSIGAVKGVEIGAGFEATLLRGSANNDCFVTDYTGKPLKVTNNAGGILGGISDGSDIILRAAIKPTPSIFKEQSTIDRSSKETTIVNKGRHDPVIVPRAVVVVESMTALTIFDMLCLNTTSKLDSLKAIYPLKFD